MPDWLTIGIRFALYMNLMLLFGLPLFGLHALKGDERQNNIVLPFRTLTLCLAPAGVALSLFSIIGMTASMAGTTLLHVDRASLKAMIVETPMGRAWSVRMLALLITFGSGVATKRYTASKARMMVVLGSASSLASLAWTGHGAASDGMFGTWHLIADIVHLLAAGAWIGALAALAAVLLRASAKMSGSHLALTHRTLDCFSRVGSVIVGLIIASGMVNSYMLVGPANILMLPSTLYGQLLMAKFALFTLMLGLAAANRFRLTPALAQAIKQDRTLSAIKLLRLSLIFEASTACFILGLVAWLGTLEPPMST